jgi:hypothetical protein
MSTRRTSAAKTAEIKLNTANAYNQAASGVAGNTTQKVSDASRVDMKTSPIYKDLGVAPSDATRTFKPLIYK